MFFVFFVATIKFFGLQVNANFFTQKEQKFFLDFTLPHNPAEANIA